jgi:hypothetical protein
MPPNGRIQVPEILHQLPEVKDLGEKVPQQLTSWTLKGASLARFDQELKRGGLWAGMQPRKKANSDAASTSSAEYAAKMQDLSLQKISIMQEESVRRNDRFQQLASIDEQRFEEMRRHNEALLKHNEAMLQMEQEKFRFMREQHKED